MSDFADRLRELIEYTGLLQKEIAAKAGIKKRALDMYLGHQKSMPPADVAVRLASALGVTVEYLVTGKMTIRDSHIAQYHKLKDIHELLLHMPKETLKSLEVIVRAIAAQEQSKEKSHVIENWER